MPNVHRTTHRGGSPQVSAVSQRPNDFGPARIDVWRSERGRYLVQPRVMPGGLLSFTPDEFEQWLDECRGLVPRDDLRTRWAALLRKTGVL